MLVEVNGKQVWLTRGNYNAAADGGRCADRLLGSPRGIWATPPTTTTDYWGLDGRRPLHLARRIAADESGNIVYPLKQRWFATSTQMANEPCYVDSSESAAEPQDLLSLRPGLRRLRGARPKWSPPPMGWWFPPAPKGLPGYHDSPVKHRYDVVYVLDARGWYYRYSHAVQNRR